MSGVADRSWNVAIGGRVRHVDVGAHRICVHCHERKSLFRYRGAVKADRDHTLCFRCYRALHNSVRALRMAHRIIGVA